MAKIAVVGQPYLLTVTVITFLAELTNVVIVYLPAFKNFIVSLENKQISQDYKISIATCISV
jgi:hypothetical protein